VSRDEQRVRTMAGWIGVEISRSRVRTAGKAGYGLYRVRGSQPIARAVGTLGPDMKSCEWSEWTPYAFTLEQIERAVREAIGHGQPSGPLPLTMSHALPSPDRSIVPTRWTPAYRGRRDLGVGDPVAVKPEGAMSENDLLRTALDMARVASLVDEGLLAMTHMPECGCEGTARLTAACVRATLDGSTVRSRQRAANNEFQAEHLERRRYGLEARHAAKLARAEGNGRELGPSAR
jgi:hypothetical protein